MTQAAGTTDVDAQALVKAAQRVLFHADADRIFDAIDQGTKEAAVADLPCPGSKIRSGGKGRGLGRGGGKGPIGVPIGVKTDPDIETLPEALQGKAYKVKKKVPKPGFPKATALLAAANALLKKDARKGTRGRKAAAVRAHLIKEAGRSLVILKYGNATEKRAGAALLSKIIPLLGRLGGGAGRLLGGGLGAAGAAAGKAGLGGIGGGLGAAAKAIPTSVGAGTRGAGLGALLAGGGLLGGGAAVGRASKSAPKSAPKKKPKKEPEEQEAAA